MLYYLGNGVPFGGLTRLIDPIDVRSVVTILPAAWKQAGPLAGLLFLHAGSWNFRALHDESFARWMLDSFTNVVAGGFFLLETS